jgi:CHAT domain-containing protein/Tfp pilus assembly protein PilF
MAQGLQSFQRGDFGQAVISWREAARLYEDAQQSKAHREALTHLSQAYQALGQNRKAVESLQEALALAKKSADQTQIAFILGSLGNAHIATGSAETAEQYLREGLGLAKTLGNATLTAVILNNLGNLFLAQNKTTNALDAYRESAMLAKETEDHAVAARALTNAARVALQEKQYIASKALLNEAWEQISVLEHSHDTAYGLISLGLTYRDLRPHLPASSDSLLLLAFKAFQEALDIAQRISDLRAMSYARGYLGHLYELEHRYEEALQLTRQAVFAAQQVQAPESLYRWQWQTGRLLNALGQLDAAITAYERAVDTLQSLRTELPRTYGGSRLSFREEFGSLYFERVDLLLRRADALQEHDPLYPTLLQQARITVERFKVAELREYFQGDCMGALQPRETSLDEISQQAVVVYPILLPDRLELLVSLPTGLKKFPVPITADTLQPVVRRFREKLQTGDRRYLRDAQDLYDWLIRPFEPALPSFNIKTLIFVPDGVLRTIPMAALHDGEQFLISKYALATTPGLDLTDPRPVTRENIEVLVGGLTKAVQGYSQLPYVSEEIQAIQRLYNAEVLLNEEFHLSKIEKELTRRPFRIVHIASHGRFAPDVEQSFLLTFDDKLTMDRLEEYVGLFRFRDDPLELLTLSACETALGDDRAALGLAGVAIKAGARSTLATLWLVEDQATAILMAEFYQQLRDPSVSRAVALQRAQLKLFADPDRQHPFFWAPFLLINNWL